MSIRQTAWPVGTALAALVLPPIAAAHGARTSLLFPAVLCVLAAAGVAVLVRDPPRPRINAGEADQVPGRRAGTGNPYRGSFVLQRLHLSSALLVIPQFVVAGFSVVYLVEQRGWDPIAAGRLVFVYQLVGAAGRIVGGVWSDGVGSRLRPMRQLAGVSAACMAALAIGAWTHSWVVVAVLGIGAIVTVADNGLGYTSVAELAGHDWAGRALATQNWAQNICGMLTPPVTAAVIGHDRYGLAFALATVFPLIAIRTTPVAGESGSP
jgi:sugar phosphate permease